MPNVLPCGCQLRSQRKMQSLRTSDTIGACSQLAKGMFGSQQPGTEFLPGFLTKGFSELRFQVLGRKVVIWYDGNSAEWKTFADVCPHRLAPLSEGRIDEAGCLQCSYHGWSFGGNGSCTRIPQAQDEGPEAKAASMCFLHMRYFCLLRLARSPNSLAGSLCPSFPSFPTSLTCQVIEVHIKLGIECGRLRFLDELIFPMGEICGLKRSMQSPKVRRISKH